MEYLCHGYKILIISAIKSREEYPAKEKDHYPWIILRCDKHESL